VSSWNLNLGILNLFGWTKDFNPSFQTSDTAQVWVRIYGLPQEYWRPKIFFAIASSAGTRLFFPFSWLLKLLPFVLMQLPLSLRLKEHLANLLGF
jgi:hypothetical protein